MSLAGIRIICTFALMGLTVASALAQERPFVSRKARSKSFWPFRTRLA